MSLRLSALLATSLLLAGCDLLGLGPDPRVTQREADGRAIGAACRHAMRGIEDCYRLNERAPKTAIFEGWKEMDQYMRDNKIEGAPSTVAGPVPSADTMLSDQQTGGNDRNAPRTPSR
jgi:hypothetical protein